MHKPIGYHERTVGSWLFPLVARLMSQGSASSSVAPGWESQISAALRFKDVLHLGTRLPDVEPDQLLHLPGTPVFPLGSPLFADLIHFVSYLMHRIGVWKNAPAVLEYRRTPELTFDDVLDLMLTREIVFPSYADLNGDKTNWGIFINLIPEIIRGIHKTQVVRNDYAERLRRAIQNIGFKIWRGAGITDLERQAFLAFAPQGDRAFTNAELDAGVVSWAQHARVAECQDPMVAQTWKLFSDAVTPKTYLDCTLLIAERSGRAVAFTLGPAPTDLPVQLAYLNLRGPFSNYQAKTLFSFNWDKASVISAIREREASIYSGETDSPFRIEPPVITGYDPVWPFFSHLEEPSTAFTLYYADEFRGGDHVMPLLSEFDVRYHHTMIDRVLDTALGNFYSPLSFIYDTIYAGKELGKGERSNLQITDFLVIAEAACDPSCGFSALIDPTVTDAVGGIDGPLFSRLDLLAGDVYLPNARDRTVQVHDAPFDRYFTRFGRVLIIPGGREHAVFPSAALHRDVAELASFVSGRIGLTPEEQRTVQSSMTVSINSALLNTFFLPEQLPSINPLTFAATQI